jgi:hypothetical protein
MQDYRRNSAAYPPLSSQFIAMRLEPWGGEPIYQRITFK